MQQMRHLIPLADLGHLRKGNTPCNIDCCACSALYFAKAKMSIAVSER